MTVDLATTVIHADGDSLCTGCADRRLSVRCSYCGARARRGVLALETRHYDCLGRFHAEDEAGERVTAEAARKAIPCAVCDELIGGA